MSSDGREDSGALCKLTLTVVELPGQLIRHLTFLSRL
jgi:hypothetical protein